MELWPDGIDTGVASHLPFGMTRPSLYAATRYYATLNTGRGWRRLRT